MVQRYTFLHKINGNENVFVLNFIKSNNLKVDGYKNSVRTASLPNSNAISISTYQCLSYHNLKGLHNNLLTSKPCITNLRSERGGKGVKR